MQFTFVHMLYSCHFAGIAQLPCNTVSHVCIIEPVGSLMQETIRHTGQIAAWEMRVDIIWFAFALLFCTGHKNIYNQMLGLLFLHKKKHATIPHIS